jgi:tetratricopeptide (TPR) repeat protein
VLECEVAFSMSWHRAAVHRQRAAALLALGRSEDAIHAYREALLCDPEDADAQLRVGLLLRELGRDEEANQAFAAALQLRSASRVANPQQRTLKWTTEPARPAPGGKRSDKIGE